MDDDQIIRHEAKTFAKRSLRMQGRDKPIESFEKVKSRLFDFYSSEAKSVFLDEIRIWVIDELQSHRNNKHEGQADPNCLWETKAEKLLFYIRQEVGTLPVVVHQKNPNAPEQSRSKVFVS